MSDHEDAGGVALRMDRIDRAAKAAERDLARRRTLAGARPATAKDAADHAARVARLRQLHAAPFRPQTWSALAERGRLEVAARPRLREFEARKALNAYRPTLIDQLVGRERERRRALAAAVVEAARADEAEYQQARAEAARHNAQVEFAERLLALEPVTLELAFTRHTGLPTIADVLGDVVVDRSGACGGLNVRALVLPADEMPDELVDSDADGARILRLMRPGERHELHCAYVCSAALRLATETLGLFAAPSVQVTLACDLDLGGEAPERAAILRMAAPADQMQRISGQKVDPIATAVRLGARTSWTAAAGFRPLD